MIESPRPDLDAAIDRVAARLVDVPGDEEFLARTMAQLPERKATPWFLTMRVQLAAAAAVVLVAFLFARPSRELPRREDPPVAAIASAVAPAPDPRSLVPGPRSLVPDPRSPIPGPRSLVPDPRSQTPERPDHERSLAPVAAIDALELSGIAPPAMELDAAAALEPLVLPELALDTKGDS
jgi:hypothetical protein